jgi:hypothetical protein
MMVARICLSVAFILPLAFAAPRSSHNGLAFAPINILPGRFVAPNTWYEIPEKKRKSFDEAAIRGTSAFCARL